MSQLLGTIQDCEIVEGDDKSVSWVAKMAVDVDGSPNWRRDPDGQADTSLHFEGKPINADDVPYIVVPPLIQNGVQGIVLGCQGEATYRGKTVAAVVADIGPHHKIGEGSSALAVALGINPSPTRGGVDEHVVHYRIWPGQAAVVNGVAYNLQPA
jgi:hypothetical protein